ncbi:hypothetical protein [Moritella viscosa]|uniref:hypothetical protein n=1 Tax=Moritella viscosa TaxID=80854 RepID=UPI000910959B|nr:hypothetical protein [Moritella viscosa]SGY90288.1 Inner membrane protein oxaA [Moritella viscosa]
MTIAKVIKKTLKYSVITVFVGGITLVTIAITEGNERRAEKKALEDCLETPAMLTLYAEFKTDWSAYASPMMNRSRELESYGMKPHQARQRAEGDYEWEKRQVDNTQRKIDAGTEKCKALLR